MRSARWQRTRSSAWRGLSHRQGRNGDRERAYPHAARPPLCGLKDIEEVHLNGDMDRRVPHNLNVSFNFVEANR